MYADEDFGPLDHQFGLALDYCEPLGLGPLRLEGGMHYSFDDANGTSGGQETHLRAWTFELLVGVNLSHLFGRLRPYVGAGAGLLFLDVRGVDEEVDVLFEDGEGTLGAYLKAGLLFQVTPTSHLASYGTSRAATSRWRGPSSARATTSSCSCSAPASNSTTGRARGCIVERPRPVSGWGVDMRRLLAVLCLLAPLASGQDVLIILADDIAQADIDQLQSRGMLPNIGALARAGVRFRNAFGNPVCSPSRRSFQFSRWYFRESGTGCAAAPTGIEPPLEFAG
jgi:hypothetical protein